MDKKDEHEEEKNMAAATKPIQHMTIEFNNSQEEKDFIKYAFGEIKPSEKIKEITEMIRNHKRAKERKRQ